jgi:hypothetical protein
MLRVPRGPARTTVEGLVKSWHKLPAEQWGLLLLHATTWLAPTP